MRAVAIGMALVSLSLSACKREPSFDERYDSARKVIREKASELDRDMSQRHSEAAQEEPRAPSSEALVPSGST